jgi:hypothetical protein
MKDAGEKRARVPFSRIRRPKDVRLRRALREKVSAKPTDEGVRSTTNVGLVLTPTLSRKRERGRGSAR